jgi:peroxiredoxin
MRVLTSIAIISLIFLLGCVQRTQTKTVQQSQIPQIDIPNFISLKVGSAAPDFSLTAISGKIISLKEELSAGKPVLIQTMAPGCASCVASLKPLSTIYDGYSNKVSFIAFNVGAPDEEYLKEYVREHGFKGEFVTPRETILKAYGIMSTDLLYVIGKDGILKVVRNSPRSAEEWEKVFESVI